MLATYWLLGTQFVFSSFVKRESTDDSGIGRSCIGVIGFVYTGQAPVYCCGITRWMLMGA